MRKKYMGTDREGQSEMVMTMAKLVSTVNKKMNQKRQGRVFSANVDSM